MKGTKVEDKDTDNYRTQALRRSIKGDKNDSKLGHISVTPKSAVAIVPPKKVPPPSPHPLFHKPFQEHHR